MFDIYILHIYIQYVRCINCIKCSFHVYTLISYIYVCTCIDIYVKFIYVYYIPIYTYVYIYILPRVFQPSLMEGPNMSSTHFEKSPKTTGVPILGSLGRPGVLLYKMPCLKMHRYNLYFEALAFSGKKT